MNDRIPPQDIDAEVTILGSCLLSSEVAAVAMSEIDSQDFYAGKHKEIFESITKIVSSGGAANIITVASALRDSGKIEFCGGISYLSTITSVVPANNKAADICKIIREKAKARRLITVASEMVERCYSGETAGDVLSEFGQEVVKISSDGEKTVESARVIIGKVFKRIEDTHRGEIDCGVPTGFGGLERLFSGLPRSEVTVIAGRPGMGKTTFAMNLMTNAASKGHKVLVFSLEMSKERLIQKALSSSSGVDTKRMDRGTLRDEDWPKLTRGVGIVGNLPITIDDASALSISQIQARAKMLAIRQGVDLVMIDYLQLAKAKAETREREISEISAGLKALAKDLAIPVVALSQLSRKCEERSDKRPLMSDLRESGSIEQDAAIVMFLYRDDFYNRAPDNPLRGATEVIVPKNRYGEPGTAEMFFDGAKCKFSDVSYMEEN
jgi:replicative DNA helicase